jgi:hypothetical protein
LGLDYELSVYDHNTGRVTANLTIADQGRLKPLQSVQLVVPSAEGTGYVDLSVALQTWEEDGKLRARVHCLKALADRAEIQLRTSHLDGKQEMLTWYYHVIPIAEHLKDEAQSGQPEKATTADDSVSLPAASVEPKPER